MKLRNLLFGTMAAIAFTACTNDDVPALGEADAYLSFRATDGSVKTKASEYADQEVGFPREAYIHDLTAIIFDAANKVAYIKDTTVADANSASIDRIAHIKVKVKDYDASAANATSETTFSMVLIANAKGQFAGVKDLAEFQALASVAITNFDFNSTDKPCLPMASTIYQISGVKKDTENWLGTAGLKYGTDYETGIPTPPEDYAPEMAIPLTRLVARIQLEHLNTNFTGTWAGASFNLKQVFFANVRETSLYTNSTFDNINASLLRGNAPGFTPSHNLIYPGAVNSMYTMPIPTAGIAITPAGEDVSFINYVYENKNQVNGYVTPTSVPVNQQLAYATRIILYGDVTLNGVLREGRYFHIIIKDPTATTAVTANTIYKVTATITGEGSPDPDELWANACISAEVDVLPWKVVIQTEDDIN